MAAIQAFVASIWQCEPTSRQFVRDTYRNVPDDDAEGAGHRCYTSAVMSAPTNSATVSSDFCAPANIHSLGWSDWFTKCREAEFKQKVGELEKLITEAGQFSSDGDRANAIAKKLGIANYWQTTSENLTADSFSRRAEVPCSPLFNKVGQVALKLTLLDRLPLFDQQPATSQARDNVLVVQCGSRFVLAGGVGFSTIPNKEFAIVKGTPTTPATTSTARFDLIADPKVHPLPIAAVHTRWAEFSNHRFAMHATFGVGANVRSASSGGSSIEFLIGPSVSFLRTVFFTVGMHVGKTTELAGGFKAGDNVPSDVTSVQVNSSYTRRLGFAVTFTKP